MPEFDDLIAHVKRLSAELDSRVTRHEKLELYVEGDCPMPSAVTEARLTKAYRLLMPVAEAPWGSLIVDSKLDRLEVSGLRDAINEDGAKAIWENAWQGNDMDSESQLAHGASLLDGRCCATVWPGKDGASPDIALDDMTQMVVEYAPGSRKVRVAALRRWKEGKRIYATLYRPEGLYKFQGPEDSAHASTVEWEKRVEKRADGSDEPWPLPNPFPSKKIPVVELRVNGKLKAGVFPYARGEFGHCYGLIDRIHLLTFLGLIVAFWMGFPLRGVIGEKLRHRVLKDDDGNEILDEATNKPKTEVVPAIDAHADSQFQLENPEAKLAEYKAADRKNLSIYDELQQLAVISKTPRHYFPMEGGISNIATETVNAYEGSMHAAVTKHKGSLGTGWEEVCRLAGEAMDTELSPSAKMLWKDHESRSLAERADAASKLKDVIPPIAVAEMALNATPEQLARWSSLAATDPLLKLLEAAKADTNGASAPVAAG